MRPDLLHRIVLVVAGLILIAVGAGAAFAPDAFYLSYGIVLDDGPSLRSELRAAGSALLLVGVTVGAGAFTTRLTTASTLIGAIVLLGYSGGRLLSWAVDGAPSFAFAVAGAVELAVGAVCVWMLVRRLRRSASPRRSAAS